VNKNISCNSPLISIVLGSYNRLRFIKKTIYSIRTNDIDIPYEIIVIDGGSTDGTIKWLAKQKDIITIIQYNRIKIKEKLIMKKSWGYFMNLGFKISKGKYILMISDDCILHPNAIMNGYHLFEEELSKGHKIGAIAFYWRNFPEQEEYWVGKTLGNKIFVNHGMYLRNALEDVGWIEENYYRFYHIDGDLCLKMWQKGYKVIDSPNSYIEHICHVFKKIKTFNYRFAKEDWGKYLERWEGIFYFPEKNNIGGWLKKKYDDPYHVYKIIINSFPKIRLLYCKNKIYKKHLYIKTYNVLRKIKNYFKCILN